MATATTKSLLLGSAFNCLLLILIVNSSSSSSSESESGGMREFGLMRRLRTR